MLFFRAQSTKAYLPSDFYWEEGVCTQANDWFQHFWISREFVGKSTWSNRLRDNSREILAQDCVEKFRRGKCCFFRVIFDGFVFILFHDFKWYFHPVFACTVFMLFRPIFVFFLLAIFFTILYCFCIFASYFWCIFTLYACYCFSSSVVF